MTPLDLKDLDAASELIEEAEKFMNEAALSDLTLEEYREDRRKEQVKYWLLSAENFLTEAADRIRRVNRLQ